MSIDYAEVLKDNVWKHPDGYGGFSPDGDYVILSRHRDSDALERSNYESAFAALREVEAKSEFNSPEMDSSDERNTSYDGWTERAHAWVYDFRAGHWAVGWVEYLLVRDDAPEEILVAAAEIVASLADYPVLDEEDYSRLEYEEAQEYWSSMSMRSRLEALDRSRAKCSMFVVRRDELPDDCYLYEYLRTP